MRGRLAFVMFAAIAAPATAEAGRTFYGWLYDTEVMPERGAELQTWITEENFGADQGHAHQTAWFMAPLVGVTDQLELAMPLDFAWTKADGAAPKFTFADYGIEARYRFVTQDPVDAPPFAPLLRVALKRSVAVRDAVIPEADLVGSYTVGKLHAVADAGFAGTITPDGHHFELHPGAGASIEAVGDLRFGAEVFGVWSLDSSYGGESWLIAGPDMSWTHGRFWMTATFGIGLYQIKDAPRIQWGIAF